MFIFNYSATPEIYTYLHTLSLHDALPSCPVAQRRGAVHQVGIGVGVDVRHVSRRHAHPAPCLAVLDGGVEAVGPDIAEEVAYRALVIVVRSEEHTSETPVTNAHLVCRLLLEKKKQHHTHQTTIQ